MSSFDSLATAGCCPTCPFLHGVPNVSFLLCLPASPAFVLHYVTYIGLPLTFKPPGKFCCLLSSPTCGKYTGHISLCLNVPHSQFVLAVPSAQKPFT